MANAQAVKLVHGSWAVGSDQKRGEAGLESAALFGLLAFFPTGEGKTRMLGATTVITDHSPAFAGYVQRGLRPLLR